MLSLTSIDTKATTSPADYLGATVRLIDGYGSKGAKRRPFNQYAAVQHFSSWVYKATMLNANAVARIPLRLYVRRKSTGTKLYRTDNVTGKRLRYLTGKHSAGGRPMLPSDRVALKVAEWDGQFDEVTEPHPVLRTLTSVNPWMGGFRLTQLRMIYLMLCGNAYTHKVLGPLGVPAQLWPMPSQWTSIKPSKTDFIDGYIYGAGRENEKFFPPDEVIHNKLPNPSDMHYGLGKVQTAWTALGLHTSKRTMDQAKFDNMNRPDWFVAFKAGVNPDALSRFEAKVDEKFSGTNNAGKFLAIGSDATIQALNQAMEEIGDADRIVEEIAAAFETPVSMLKANDPNRASAQTADTAWLRDTVRPLALGDEEELNEQLLSDYDVGEDAFLAYDPVSFEDESTIRRNAAAGVASSLLTVNEGREEIGYGPVPGGDVRYPPSGATGPNASLQGNMAPGQMTERTNENGVTPGGALPSGEAVDKMIKTLREALTPPPQAPPVINVTLPDYPAAPAISFDVKMPDYPVAPVPPATVVNVTVPEQPAQVAPNVIVNIPEQAAQAAPVVNVTIPEQAAPVVHFHSAKTSIKTIERDGKDRITKIREEES